MSDDLIGKKVGGYEILGIIGRGGMATVYRALQTSMNRIVALKLLPRHFLHDSTYLQRFEREVKIVAQLEHRNIVPVHDYGECEQQPFIVMRYMAGGSVEDLLAAGPMDERVVLGIIAQIAPALDYAHSKNVLHRDLKPSNILLDDGGGAYITDFGIARILDTEGQLVPTITTQGVVGTPSYMSPEQAQGKPLDGRSDVYSLGVMLFEMLTARRPFVGDTPYSIAVMQVTNQPPMPRAINPQISAAVEQVILKTLKKLPENRYQTAVQLAEALKPAIEHPQNSYDAQAQQASLEPGLEVTQPMAVQSTTSGASPTAPTPPSTQPVPATGSFPSAPTPASASLRVVHAWEQPRRQRWGWRRSILVGGLIGCGLLSLVTLVAAIALDGLLLKTESPTPTITLTETSATPSGDATPTLTAEYTPEVTRPPGVHPISVEATPSLPPDYDPEIGMIVYFAQIEGSSTSDIYQLDLQTGEHIQLTNGEGDSSYPLVSPDGTRLVFQSNRDGDFEIYVMDMTSGVILQLTVNEVLDRLPSWSPDGEWIVYSSDTRQDGNYDLYRVAATGGDSQLIYSDGNRNSHPRYSYDGRYLVFTSGEGGDARTWEIMRLDLSTGEVRQLTENNTRDASPSFSRDNRYILYNAAGAGEAAIARMSVDGNESTILYDGVGWEWGMSYSPDGSLIVFNSQIDEVTTLYLMRADGTGLREIETEYDGYYPSWIP